MNNAYTVGQYLVDRLYQLGLDHLFSIAGDYSIRWVQGYVAPSPIKVIEEVNELNAGYAADGYARIKGIGALCVTYSAGALCAVNAIAGAYVERVPVVLINGTPDLKKTITFEQTGFSAHHFITGRGTDLQCFEHLTAASVRIDNPDLAGVLIDYALTRCITLRQPVYIELLQDMVDLECAPPQGDLKPARTLSDASSLQAAVDAITAQLRSAVKPLIWVGVEVDRLGLQSETATLLRHLDTAYVTELLSKAVLPEDDALFGGVFDGQASAQSAHDLVADADFILALGVWLTDLNCLGWDPPYAKTAFASHDAVKIGTEFYAQVALADLVRALTESGVEVTTPLTCPSSSTAPHSIDDDARITYTGLYDFVPRYVDEKTIIGCDASLNYFGSLQLTVPSGRAFFAQPSYSSIGYISPAATGICLAKRADQRVLVFAGDGGFQMSAQCLSTQTRFGLDPIIFLIDNGVYGVEQWLADPTVFTDQEAFYESCQLHRWEYAKLADVFGCRGWRVETYGELDHAVRAALANTGSPSVIQIALDAKSLPVNAGWKKT